MINAIDSWAALYSAVLVCLGFLRGGPGIKLHVAEKVGNKMQLGLMPSFILFPPFPAINNY